ncbi:Uncharacterised protein [uncultured archaeon]|nr:Uncharacterised protein [uncultured archaeon]
MRLGKPSRAAESPDAHGMKFGDIIGGLRIMDNGTTDERRFVAITHLKGCEEKNKSLCLVMKKSTRQRTRMTRIGRIPTDKLIRVHPRHLCNPCSIAFSPLPVLFFLSNTTGDSMMSAEPAGAHPRRWKPYPRIRIGCRVVGEASSGGA